MKKLFLGAGLALAAASVSLSAGATSFAPTSGKLLLIGQSNKAAWDNWTTIGSEPNGGSVYYEVKSQAFNKGLGNAPIHQQYADFVSGKTGKYIQIGVSWKDNPPGWDGNDATHAAASQAATLALANGTYLSNFDNLINYINAHGGTKFLIRVDYEVSSAFHCTDSSCSSYKNAFNKIATYMRGKNTASNIAFVYHPVRGEFEALYPGDANVDWIGLSTFNHELCMPIYNQTQYLYNGTPGVGYDTATNQCKGYILVKDANGNNNAQPYSFNYDFNVLSMVKFAKDHGKPMIYSESSPMNFQAGQNSDGTDSDALAATWANRYFALMNYNGPLPNQVGTYDLSGVIKAVVYMNLDLRYGWDGYYGQSGFAFPFDDMWFNNVELTRYNAYKTAFCNGLSAQGFLATCGGGSGGGSDTQAPSVPGSLAVTGTTSSSISLGWSVSTDNVAVTRYEIFNSAGTQLGTSTANSYTAGSLAASTTYGFQVRACDAANNCSAKTAVVSGTTQAGSGGGSTNLPGVVTTTSFTGSKSFTVNAPAAGTYYFVISYSSTASSKLITTTFNGSNTNAAVNSGTGSVQTTDFASVAAGSKTLTVNAESGVTVTKVEAFKR
ncbi:glycosyl hydrolase [Niveibacterium sp. SC-1]|uniref:fibronectin type III domain-containing protein n=1 Tax=Niveibacterium sp. SC-1 TaxID=3135646 RepID=UPI00311FEBBB